MIALAHAAPKDEQRGVGGLKPNPLDQGDLALDRPPIERPSVLDPGDVKDEGRPKSVAQERDELGHGGFRGAILRGHVRLCRLGSALKALVAPATTRRSGNRRGSLSQQANWRAACFLLRTSGQAQSLGLR